MFPLLVQKMRQTLTFLATIENNHNGHENLGHYFDSGAAHDFRGSLYGPAFDKRSAGHPKGELRPAFKAGPSFGRYHAFGRSSSQTHNRASRSCGIPDRVADFRCGDFSACTSASDQRVAFSTVEPMDGTTG